jgi:PAS domain S-box-containing protein
MRYMCKHSGRRHKQWTRIASVAPVSRRNSEDVATAMCPDLQASKKTIAGLPTPDFRALFEALPGLYLVLLPDQPNYTIVAVNAAYAQATLTKPDEIVGRGLFDVFPDNPGDQQATGVRNLSASLRRVLATQATDTMAPQKYDIRRPDSEGGEFEERYWSPVNTPVLGTDGQVRFIIHRVEDITDFLRLKQREAEHGRLADAERLRADQVEAELFLRSRELAQVRELIAERQLLTLLVERSPDFIAIADLQGVPVYANPSAVALIGARDLKAIQATPFPDFFVPDQRSFVRDTVLPTARDRGRWEGELLFQHLRTQESIPVHYDLFRVDNPAGEPTHFATITQDLRERKRIEDELRASERRFSVAFAEAPVGMVLTTPEGIILDINKAFLDMLGYELTAHDSAHITHPDDVSRTREFYVYLREHHRAPAAIEKRYVRKDGRILWARASGSMRCDQAGRPTQMVGIIEDITERKRAETALRQQWHTFDTALSHTPDFTYIFDLDGRFTYVNRALLSLWQKPLEEAVGKNFFDLGYPEHLAARLQRQIQQVIHSRAPLRDQTPFTGPTGATGHYEYIFVPVFAADGRVEAVTGSTRDVTERNKAEEAVRTSEERLTLALEAGGGVGTWDWDIPSDRVYCNPQFASLFSIPPEAAAAGAPVSRFTAQIHPDDRGRVGACIRTAIETGGEFSAEHRVVQPDGSLRWVYARGRCHLDTERRPTRFPGVVFDITERKRAEEELRRSNEELKRVNRELEEFAYVAGHDLQEPLRMVNIYTQMILGDVVAQNAAHPDLDLYAGFVRQGVTRMQALIRDLLTFSRTVQADERPAGAAALADALDEALSVLKDRIDEDGVRITAGPLPTVRADVSQMAHVFQNLLSNAIKYRRPRIPAEVHISAQTDGASWIVSVRDNGIGFEPQYAERIFGLFKRLHKDEYPGTGLGLAICKRIVERYGGRLWAEGRPGDGATFYFSLPEAGP